ncbi:cocaine- and amphetamine-regulated transcript protein-like [Catharus ustulatus]|uniref:cocaine- and amphetamine-regulated transcript protein-like n=1 Tax=Catharus ustulatus TaxID=91951 RepID=UPI00140DDCCB|nr:cocaine- and amphetamine-regulated transcript protein-like [Catharus ustulatus]
MERARLCQLCLLGSALLLLGTPEPVPELRASREDTELAGLLQELLDEPGPRELPALEKRLSWVPWCARWESCAVRRGARIGKRCSCAPGTSCDLRILKCS